MAKRYYELHVSGCTRHLPVLNISDKVAIAGFVILGDVEIVENTARDLAAKVPKDCEYVMTAETKDSSCCRTGKKSGAEDVLGGEKVGQGVYG